MIEDILKALDRVPAWKRLGEVPAEIEDMKRRIAQLEEQLGGKYAPEICRFCGERTVRLKNVLGPDEKGMLHEEWDCGKCGRYDMKLTKGR